MASEDRQFEYKIVKVTALRKRAGASEQERTLNDLAGDGWELVDARRSDVWDWSWDSSDSLVMRRVRLDGGAS